VVSPTHVRDSGSAIHPVPFFALQQRYPGVPYELALCRQIIDQVCIELRQYDPERSDRVVARLEAELQAHLESEMGLHLP